MLTAVDLLSALCIVGIIAAAYILGRRSRDDEVAELRTSAGLTPADRAARFARVWRDVQPSRLYDWSREGL